MQGNLRASLVVLAEQYVLGKGIDGMDRSETPSQVSCHRHAAAVLLTMMAACVAATPARAVVFSPGFAGPGLDTGLVADGSAGTSASAGGGTLVLRQQAGQGDGGISVTTMSPVSGDFIATVTASVASLGHADLGIVLGTADWVTSLADVFVNNLSGTVNGNIFLPVFSGVFLPNTSDIVTLTISRVGNVISDIYDSGSGPVLINSGDDPSLAVPINIGLFLLEAAGDTGAHEGSFIHLALTSSDAPIQVIEPASIVMFGTGLLGLGLLHTRSRSAAKSGRATGKSGRLLKSK
jgi:hypothetical protein